MGPEPDRASYVIAPPIIGYKDFLVANDCNCLS